MVFYLYILSEGSEHLFGNINGSAEVSFSWWVNDIFTRVVPVKVHHGLLKSQQVIHCTDHNVHSSVVTSLGSQVVLEFFIKVSKISNYNSHCYSASYFQKYACRLWKKNARIEQLFVVLLHRKDLARSTLHLPQSQINS